MSDNYPPPPGGYPPPPGGFGGFEYSTPGGPTPYTVGAAFSWGWKKFQENLGTIIAAIFVYLILTAVLEAIWYVIINAIFGNNTSYDARTGTYHTDSRSFFGFLLVSALSGLVLYILEAIMQAGFIRGATDITRGRAPELAKIFSTDNLANILVAGILIGVATAVGTLLCLLPGLIVIFYSQFAMFFVVEHNMSALDGIRASIVLVRQNVGTLIGFFFAGLGAIIVGAILCGVGLLVAIPVVFLAQAYTYRSLQGEAVAP